MTLQEEIQHLLNKCCAENASNTPDFILAEYLYDCLKAFEKASNAREKWYNVRHEPGQNSANEAFTCAPKAVTARAAEKKAEGTGYPIGLFWESPDPPDRPVAVAITPNDLGWPKELPKDYPLGLCICGQCASKVRISELPKEVLGHQFCYTMNWCGLCGRVKCRHNIHIGEPYHDVLMKHFFPNGF